MFTPKHQKKVNECYSTVKSCEGASNGKISSLIYYINAKPSKLLKVASYLCKKIPTDIYKQMDDYNYITFDIINSILDDCSDYYTSFCPYLLEILLVFGSNKKQSKKIAHLTNELFLRFCEETKKIISSIRDGEFYDNLTLLYKKFLNPDIDNEKTTSRLLSTISMEDFKSPKADKRLQLIIKLILKKYGTIIDIINFFKITVRNSNSTSLVIIINILWEQFDIEGWTNQKLCEDFNLAFAVNIPSQYLCIYMTMGFKKLERSSNNNLTTSLVNSISYLIESNRTPLGYSSIGITNNLLKLLRKQRPDQSLDTRNSFIGTRLQPHKTIYAICNSIVALLKNANFTLQKYEIISNIISRTFYDEFDKYNSSYSKNQNELSISEQDFDKHSLCTVTLNTEDESHYRSVVWGILFALCEEGSTFGTLQLGYSSDIHNKLLNQLFEMIRTENCEISLNSAVLLNHLIENGLPLVHSRRSNHKIMLRPLSKVANRTFSKLRYSLAVMINQNFCTLLHLAASFSVIQSSLKDCDFSQIAFMIRFMYYVVDMISQNDHYTLSDKSLIVIFMYQNINSINSKLDKSGKMSNLVFEFEMHLKNAGIPIIEAREVIDGNVSTVDVYKITKIDDVLISKAEIQRALLDEVSKVDKNELENCKSIFCMDFKIDDEKHLGFEIDKHSKKYIRTTERPQSDILHRRLSKLSFRNDQFSNSQNSIASCQSMSENGISETESKNSHASSILDQDFSDLKKVDSFASKHKSIQYLR